MNKNFETAQRSSYILLRLCEKMLNYLHLAEVKENLPKILEGTSTVINLIFTNPKALKLGYEECLNLYNILGIFVSSNNVDSVIR